MRKPIRSAEPPEHASPPLPHTSPTRRPPQGRLGRLGRTARARALAAAAAVSLAALSLSAQAPSPAPRVGQAGKDVIWVPTPASVVEAMLDLAQVTPDDYVVDLGSGDGRAVIAAARRGARALGVEYDATLVDVSRTAAAEAGVATRATFVQGDMYAADVSEASVLALYLLPQNLQRLTPTFLRLRPGTRIVSNTFWIEGWEPDLRRDIEQGPCDGCSQLLLYIVPARVDGEWRMDDGSVLRLAQAFQMVTGTLEAARATAVPVTEGRLRGTQLAFAAGGGRYAVTVNGDALHGAAEGPSGSRPFTAQRMR